MCTDIGNELRWKGCWTHLPLRYSVGRKPDLSCFGQKGPCPLRGHVEFYPKKSHLGASGQLGTDGLCSVKGMWSQKAKLGSDKTEMCVIKKWASPVRAG
jgi:hypothetical protein